MHTLQPKHTILKDDELQKVLQKFHITIAQLPKIKSTDPAVPEGTALGKVMKIERKESEKVQVYYRVVA
ncbi:DNA-directed RNA polymerase subunit H [Candidatus Pacearchaeota archaeon]|nr:DNA-directed RNA polymerase subunit H [Candidatus Pacearchaeota archaeon]